ncbi:SPOR domain-containing protein [Cellulomonas sp. IC4_254]|nr:SPOR domain-containing protein [Cellulomonas sp. IC4_254]
MADEFYYNTETGQVEQGKQSTWSHLLGPYPTREAAQHALEKARERTEAWDEEDRRDA